MRPLSFLSDDLLSEALSRCLRHARKNAGGFCKRRGVWVGPHPLPMVWEVLDEYKARRQYVRPLDGNRPERLDRQRVGR